VRKIIKMNCSECDAAINVPDDASVGEIVSCPECGADFEISKKSGPSVELKPAESVGEDWGE
jgi:alpha-aminoadipate carrier protein LysW